MRDLDISPDGTYAVVTDTGAYGGPDSPCDTQVRWDLTNDNPEPAAGLEERHRWRHHLRGRGHRQPRSTSAATSAGPTTRTPATPPAPAPCRARASPRSTRPTACRCPGTPAGPAASASSTCSPPRPACGSVTTPTRIGGQQHARLAFFPLAGGITPPREHDRHAAARTSTCSAVPPPAPTRASCTASTPAVPRCSRSTTARTGPADQTDPSPYRNSGSNAAGWSPSATSDGTIPATTLDRAPMALFDSERWDPARRHEMQWSFPVPAGTHVTVRLYLANRYSGAPRARASACSASSSTAARWLPTSTCPRAPAPTSAR